jgi:ubiquinone/menaquinone biosynthesis C-methylase UbiE
MHAATVDAANWWARPRTNDGASWIDNYKRSLGSRHRSVIAAIVGDLAATSVLEVGCHCGPNLIRLATEHPQIEQLTGVDVNAQAIAAGTSWAAERGLSERIQLVTGAIPAASQMLPDRCVDIVLSCYALAYIAPADRDAVLWEIGRLARRAVILAEPMTDQPGAVLKSTLDGYSEWAHNYQAASRWIGTWRGMTMRTVSVDPPVDQLRTVLVATRDES